MGKSTGPMITYTIKYTFRPEAGWEILTGCSDVIWWHEGTPSVEFRIDGKKFVLCGASLLFTVVGE